MVDSTITLYRGEFVGTCPRKECLQPMTGYWDADEHEEELKMKCVSCGFKRTHKIDSSEVTLDLDVTFEG